VKSGGEGGRERERESMYGGGVFKILGYKGCGLVRWDAL